MIVPEIKDFRIRLIDEVHSRLITVYLKKSKTVKLLTVQYYWPKLFSDYTRFIVNCRTCRRIHVFKDKILDLLHLLSIEDKYWQYIFFDFKSFPIDKKGYDNIFVIIDRFGKKTFLLFYKKTVIAVQAAELYYIYVWKIYNISETIIFDRGSLIHLDLHRRVV